MGCRRTRVWLTRAATLAPFFREEGPALKSLRVFLASLSVILLLGAAVSAQTTWTGTISTNWSHSSNWDTVTVPGPTDDVIIPSGPASQPSAYILNPECNNLTIESGAVLTLGGGFDLAVNGDLDLDGTLTVSSSTSEIAVSGDWMNDGTFNNGNSLVELDGTGALGGASTTSFGNLSIGGTTRTISSAFSVSGDVTVSSGASIDLGTALLHTVAGNWTSSAGGISLTGSSTIVFTGTGLLTTLSNTLPNMRVSAGTRSVNDSSVAGDLELTGGELRILDNATLSVAGDAILTTGTVSWESVFVGTETLDVAGDVTITAAAGTTSTDVRVFCGGTWSSDSTFAPASGLTIIDGGGTTTIGGSTPTFASLAIADGNRTFVSSAVITGNLTVADGVTLSALAAIDVDGLMSIGNGTSSWSLGSSTHTIGGGYVSTGASATSTGTIELDGTGNLGTGGGSIANVLVSAGTISVSDSTVTGNLDMTGGTLSLLDDQTCTVGGNMTLTAGTLDMISSGLATPDELFDVAGDVTITATAGTMTDDSRIDCGGAWSSTAAWAPSAGLVTLDGAGADTVGGVGINLVDVDITAGTKTLTDAATIGGDLDVASGATLDTDAALDVAGNVTLGDNTASWDVGASTHTLAGDYTSAGADATGAGTIDFGGTGTTSATGGDLPTVIVSAGTRSLGSAAITGDLDMTGGEIVILNNAEVDVAGNATMNAGMLTFDSGSPGTQVLDVEGDVALTATSGTAGSDSRIQCAGNWSSSSAWTAPDGIVDLDGGTTTTVSGATPTFTNLNVVSGTKTVSSASVISGNLAVDNNATLDTDAALDVGGNVTLGDGTASWDLGASTHNVAGDYASAGASATGAGTIDFDGTGTLATGGGTISNAISSAGTRTVSATTVSGNLDLTGGTLSIANDQTLTVGGNAVLSRGTLDFPAVSDAVLDSLDVTGNVTVTSTAGTGSVDARILCGGNWSSTPTFAPGAGTVVLNGASPSTIAGAGGVTLADLQMVNSTKTLTSTSLTVTGLDVQTATAFVSSAGTVDVNGDVTLGSASASWDLGALTHTATGNFTSGGASATGAGTIEFDGTGTVAMGGGTIANMSVTAGTRQVADTDVVGNVSLTAGTLRVLGDQTLTVGGNADFTGGLLSWSGATNGTPDVIDVAGDVTVTALAGTTTVDSRLFCAGNWSSTSAFNPPSGRVVLDGAGATTMSGVGGLTLAEVELDGGTKTLNDPMAALQLNVKDGTPFVTAAAVTLSGDLLLGTAGASWALGGFNHMVANDWTSTGGSATGAGQINFTATGTLDTGGGSIPRMLISGGTRTVNTSEVTGNATMTTGTLLIDADQGLTVGGDLDLTSGTLSWEPVADATLETIDVAGAANVQTSVGTESIASRLFCAGDWTSDATFSPVLARVVLDGGTAANVDVSTTEGTPAVFFGDLQVVSGTKTLLADADTFGEVRVEAGASLVLAADLAADDVIVEGTLDTATQTVTCSNDWTSDAVGSVVSGTGLVDFDSNGTTITGANTIPNMLVSSGLRAVSTSAVADALDMTGGELLMLDDQTLTVGGSATLSSGQLTFLDLTAGVETLDVAGDMSVSAIAGTMNTNTFIRCSGNWTSDASFTPAGGVVVLNGAGATTLGGAGMTLADLALNAGTKTVTTAFSVRDVNVGVGVALDFTGGGAMTATGDVTLGNATSSVDLGGFTHTVSGDWISAGANSTNGTLSFIANGLLSTGAATVDTVVVNGGTRSSANSAIANDLTLTTGILLILNDQTLSVGGNANLDGGTLIFDPVPAGTNEVLDVEGDVVATSGTGASANTAILRCAGNWSSNSSFSPSTLTVELDGAGTTGITALAPGFDPVFDKLVIRNGTRQPVGSFPIVATDIDIDVSGTLDTNGQALTIAGSPLTVDGSLLVDAGGSVALGSNAVTVSPTGTLSVIGDPGNPAVITGSGGGGYFMTIDGTLAARQFAFEQMGLAGITVTSGATIAAFPDDLRAGVFSTPSPIPGSVMLDIQRAAPTTFRYVDFEDPLTQGTNNVRTLSGSGAVVSFINSGGNFTGAGFELDPFNKIAWPSDDVTTIFASATAGADMITVDWTSINEADIDKYIVQRGTNSSGPFTDLLEVSPLGPSAYQHVDGTVTPKQLYFYNIAQRRTDGTVEVLAQVQANPWGSGPPPNFLTVGPSGDYADIQTAINSITTEFLPVVSIEAGTYPAFTVVPNGIGTLRILADGSGPVIIDTTLQAVEIENFGSFDSLEMSDLTIGDAGSPNAGVLVSNCLGTIVLDELVVTGGTGFAGISLAASTQVAVQRSTVVGDDGLMLDLGSVAVVLNGSLDDIDLKGLSDARLGGLTTASTVEAGSNLETLAGVQSDIDAPELVSIGSVFFLDMAGEPGGTWVLIYSLNLGWLDLAGLSWEMVGMADFGLGDILITGPMGAGSISLPGVLPTTGLMYGLPIALQTVVIHPTTSKRRWSNVTSIIGTN